MTFAMSIHSFALQIITMNGIESCCHPFVGAAGNVGFVGVDKRGAA
jgi:hypothetical protein